MTYKEVMNSHIKKTATQSQQGTRNTFASIAFGVFIVLNLLNQTASWGQNALPQATVQLPTFGVSVNAQGILLAGENADPRQSLELAAARNRAADRNANRDIDRPSSCRKVSLRRALAKCAEAKADDAIDEDLLALAGLTAIEYVFIDEEHTDVIIAGPAGRWIADDMGGRFSLANGRPVLQIEDMALAMATTSGARGEWFGCSIDPTLQALQNMAEVNRQIPKTIPSVARGQFAAELDDAIHAALGNANVRVFGIPAESRMALVLVEADYRMKRMALGLERLPIAMKSYADLVRNPPRNSGLQRWWLVPDFKSVQATEDHLNWRFVGSSVKLNAEAYQFANGQLSRTDAPVSRPCRLFADAFTSKYEQIANASPVFAELRNAMNFLVIASILKKHASLSDLDATWQTLANRSSRTSGGEPRNAPRLAPCVANVFWRGARLLAPAGGGVTIAPDKYLTKPALATVSNETFGEVRPANPNLDEWWWD